MQRALVMPRGTVMAFAVLVLLLALAGLADPGLTLAFAPAVVLLALLCLGMRPGEALISRLRARFETRAVARASSMRRPRLALVVRPVGCSLAAALAMRPPPVRL
ncbi:hypothetical protein OJ997_18025 [Solirubrobacter phytolaccae]|uniref:Uncharacterized protein n=1 Tax=Solirubrobacter phytolaccae TaxID=1404360 RepID=A0A9X3S8H5_9ACTN|nr:hypothetical protein [Solirubrobacter phytolaccae]MDA0182209.1 hypothetical protein [Solirubrobacter phytolaccae]